MTGRPRRLAAWARDLERVRELAALCALLSLAAGWGVPWRERRRGRCALPLRPPPSAAPTLRVIET